MDTSGHVDIPPNEETRIDQYTASFLACVARSKRLRLSAVWAIGAIMAGLPKRCKETDQPAATLVTELKNRGMLDDTLVVWGGEFGRTVYCQGRLTDVHGNVVKPMLA